MSSSRLSSRNHARTCIRPCGRGPSSCTKGNGKMVSNQHRRPRVRSVTLPKRCSRSGSSRFFPVTMARKCWSSEKASSNQESITVRLHRTTSSFPLVTRLFQQTITSSFFHGGVTAKSAGCLFLPSSRLMMHSLNGKPLPKELAASTDRHTVVQRAQQRVRPLGVDSRTCLYLMSPGSAVSESVPYIDLVRIFVLAPRKGFITDTPGITR